MWNVEADESHWWSFYDCEAGVVVRMVVDSLLPHAKFESNDHRKDAPPFINDNINQNLYNINNLLTLAPVILFGDPEMRPIFVCEKVFFKLNSP